MPAALVPLFIIAVWLAITTILALLSGWFRLVVAYPNIATTPSLRIRGQSGTMGSGVVMGGILTLSVCPSGLRVGLWRLFGPFCHDFLVPWECITVTRKTTVFWRVVVLRFGNPLVGTLGIAPHVANKLARAAAGQWPEVGPVPEEKSSDLRRRLMIEWALGTCLGALFFTLAPLAAPRNARPPIVVAILFPAIVMGLSTFVRFLRERD
jgi:hypothetical protein